MNIKSFFKKKTPLEEENIRFEKTFPNKDLVRKIKMLSLKEKRLFIVQCLENCLHTQYLENEAYLKLMKVYKKILIDESLNQKESYQFITPKLIENEDQKWFYKVSNPLSITLDDLNQFSRFFFMLPINLIDLFQQIEIVMLTSDEECILNAFYKVVNYMHIECVKYPEI
ncbi:hypothetical protein UJ101_00583 [Flavobacteriaceae bacterium UJ101]|nr:hypothetical protein UJ101_00583 [Flavobacteriaceae bacterium UJ101]